MEVFTSFLLSKFYISFKKKNTFNVQRKKSLLSIRDDTRMSYMIQDVACDNFNFYGRTKQKKSFFPQLFSHRHIKSDMLKSITREFLNFIFTFFSSSVLCFLKENLQKNKKKLFRDKRLLLLGSFLILGPIILRRWGGGQDQSKSR